MFECRIWRSTPKTIEVLSDIIVSDLRVVAPPEFIQHLYRKEYGLSTDQFMNEPMENIGVFLKIKELESIRAEMDAKEQRHNG